jgi:hypothetical protein
MTTTSVHIEHLRLAVSGLDEQAATEFARLVAQQLVPGLTAVAAGAEVGPVGTVGTVAVRVTDPGAAATADPGTLARSVADQVLAALRAGDQAVAVGEGG